MPRPNSNAAALRRIMQQQLATGKTLITLAEASEQALIEGNTAKLEALAPQQRGLLDTQITQEMVRQQVTRDLSQMLGVERAPTLSALLPALPRTEAMALDTLRQQILETERRMDILNQRNGILLENALGYVKFSLEALTSAALKPARYGVNLARLSAPSFYVDSKA